MRVATVDEVRVLPDDAAADPAWKKLTRQGWFLAVASPVLMLVIWEILVRVKLLDSRFFPMPTVVIQDLLVQAMSKDLWLHTGFTISRMLVGFLLGAVPGVLLGIAMGLSPVLRQLLQPAIAAIYPIPKVALFPLIMLMFGLGETSKWVIVAVAVFFQVLMATLAGVVNIERVYLDVAADFRARRWQAYRTIALPAAMPFIFTGFQLGLGMSLIVVVIAENFGTERGLGYVIWHSWQIFEVRDMYVALIVVALLGYLSQLLLARIERAVIPWRRPMRHNINT
jgi:ABC-type nitrate/sulfonate/bicarbonate transport system permease component